ncbi:MAG: polysulfide reductase NrfD [Acidobacteria bacterium]|nr:polysulfide reductase NrfD [Acidobacteriota bacterium]
MDRTIESSILRPLREPGGTRPWRGRILALGTAIWMWSCARILSEGHGLLGTGSYGVSWGLTVANTIHLIGISHVGIAVSAVVRVLGLERFRNAARIAELLTLVSLLLAVANITLDVGRPDRFLVNTLVHGRWHAPMVWSATVISLYLVSSGVYLYLSMRRDLWVLSRTELPFRALYAALSLGYRDTEESRNRHDQALSWLALALIPVMVSVHSVYGLFFGLLSARPGWHNPLQAPYFVLGAVVSGFSALVVLLALLRREFAWRELLEERLFRVFAVFLAFVIFLYLYFTGSEHLTAQYAGPPAERALSGLVLGGSYAWAFWGTMTAGLLALIWLLRLARRPGPVKVGAIAAAAALVNGAMFAKRVLLLLPPQQHPALPTPLPPGLYVPTAVELAATFGTYLAGALAFLGILRFLPAIELPLAEPEDALAWTGTRDPWRRAVVPLTIAAGLVLVVWGVRGREADFAPLKWISGLLLLALVPLEWCLLGGQGKPGAVPDSSFVRQEAEG